MGFSYLQLTTLRVLVGVFLFYAVLVDRGLLALAFAFAFIALHWFAHRVGRRGGLHRNEYQYSSLLSSVVLLMVFVLLVARKRIPELFAAVFVAAFFIKIIFAFHDDPMRKRGKSMPVQTNWSLAASSLFLACYFFGYREDLALVSLLFLAYLLLTIGAYARHITHLRASRTT
ncbi:hypothetical protein JXA12_03120 [Candidatus Woesearchaeota archaeon]|nr:hypothetical protein [Candidatus Woesearchaeota archaeon]